MADQTTTQNPTEQYPKPPFAEQAQDEPGLARDMQPKPDHGEESYHGTNRLENRKAIVTGADSGIGRATAIAFAREGADIVLSYLPEEEADANEVISLIEKEQRKAIACPGDISDENFCKELIEKAHTELGDIDILANIAGKQVAVETIAELSTEQLKQTFATNVFAMFWLCKYALQGNRI